jgi:hypothetical protein
VLLATYQIEKVPEYQRGPNINSMIATLFFQVAFMKLLHHINSSIPKELKEVDHRAEDDCYYCVHSRIVLSG